MKVSSVDVPPVVGAGAYYVSNRPPLAPSPLVKLPIGSIAPRGWLLAQLELMRDGMVGHLPEVSRWCRGDSGWLHPEVKAWEEAPYWLKGFGDLGYVLKDDRVMREAKVWIDALIASQDADGWMGPQPLKESGDAWPNMIMLFVLRSYHEATGDERVLPVMARYFRYRNSLSDEKLYVSAWGVGTYNLQWWQHVRAGDELDIAILVAAVIATLGQPVAHHLAFLPGVAARQIALDLGQQAADGAIFVGVAADALFLRCAAGREQQQGGRGGEGGVAAHGQSLYIGRADASRARRGLANHLWRP